MDPSNSYGGFEIVSPKLRKEDPNKYILQMNTAKNTLKN